MTSLAFILGCVPLAIAVGASENSRHSIGTGVIGGMLAATVVAIFFIPLFYYLAERMFGKKDSAQTAAQPALSAPPAQVSGSSASHGQERD
jgi:multidrug efflux pump